jgi:hypothetical protein
LIAIAAQENTVPYDALPPLNAALGAVAAKLNPTRATELAKTIEMAGQEGRIELPALPFGAVGIPGRGTRFFRPAPISNAEHLRQVRARLASSPYPEALDIDIATITVLLPDQQKEAAAEIMNILKFPTVAERTTTLLALLESQAGAEALNGDLWAAVEWAEEQGIDVRSTPPERPGPTELWSPVLGKLVCRDGWVRIPSPRLPDQSPCAEDSFLSPHLDDPQIIRRHLPQPS